MMQVPGVSVFIPVFNEEELLENHLNRLHTYLTGRGFPFEIIVGSNGSFDQTVPLLDRIARHLTGLRFFHQTDKGVGKAFARGATLARYNRIITVDMDLSIDLGFIEQAYHQLSRVHVVVGSKKTGNQKRSFLRKAGSSTFIFFATKLLGLSFTDYSIAAKGYRKDVVLPCLHMLDTHTFYVVLLLYHAFHQGKRIVEIPVACRDSRASRFNLVHEGFYKFSRLFGLSIKACFSRRFRLTSRVFSRL
jgi:glycosyltransferase involved in cell wall biosynthesis